MPIAVEAPLRTLVPLLLALLPSTGAEVPMAPFPECGEPDRPDLCPPDLNERWNYISYVRAEARATVRAEEVALGSGIGADRAWRTTTGRWEVVLAVVDSGIRWEEDQLANKVLLNTGELPLPQGPDGVAADTWDRDGNGVVNVQDWAEDPRVDPSAGVDAADHLLDPSDLIHTAWGPEWDGVDNDGNGFVDDIAGWDFQGDDNDPFAALEEGFYGDHGTGVMKDAAAEGDTSGDTTIGVCPGCALLPVRLSHSFVGDGLRVAEAVAYAVGRGARVINFSVGALSHPEVAVEALAWAREQGVVVVGAAGDENAWHRNFPSVADDVLFVHSIRADDRDESGSPFSYMNFYNCNNFGPRLDLSAPSTGCATGAAALTTGTAGLVLSAGLDAGLDLHPDEVRQLLLGSAADIHLAPEDLEEAATYPSAEGWDAFYGYGRLDAGRAVERVLAGDIPPVARLSSPGWFDRADPAAGTVRVEGRVSARDGTCAWVLEAGTGLEPEAWVEVGRGGGTAAEAAISVDLALADLAGLEAPGAPVEGETVVERTRRIHQPAVTLRLTATDGGGRTGQDRRTFQAWPDPDLLPGFPVILGSSAEASPAMADLDGDGDLELLVATSGGEILAFHGDGSVAAGFPLQTDAPPEATTHAASGPWAEVGLAEVREPVVAPVAVGDLDGDGILDLVAAGRAGGVYAWSDGALLPGFPAWPPGRAPAEFDGDDAWDRGFMGAPTLWDLDGDGTLEILLGGMDGRLHVLGATGTPWGPYPVEVCAPEACGAGAPVVASPSVGDVDGDGDPDVVVASNESTSDGSVSWLHVLDARTAAALSGWPRAHANMFGTGGLIPIVGEGHPAPAALADLDGDGDLEIADPIPLGPLHLLHHDGTAVMDLPHASEAYGDDSDVDEPSLSHLADVPSFGDLTGDGVPDLVQGGVGMLHLVGLALTRVQEYQQAVAAWDGRDGTFLPGWPRQVEDHQFMVAAAIADVSGDGRPEAIHGSAGGLLHAWDASGVQPPGWPRFTGHWIIGGAAVGDLDGDGWLDVAVTTREGWLYAWRTDGRADQEVKWASVHHDPANTSNHEVALPRQAGPPAVAGSGGCCGGKGTPDTAWLLLPLGLGWRARRGRHPPWAGPSEKCAAPGRVKRT